MMQNGRQVSGGGGQISGIHQQQQMNMSHQQQFNLQNQLNHQMNNPHQRNGMGYHNSPQFNVKFGIKDVNQLKPVIGEGDKSVFGYEPERDKRLKLLIEEMGVVLTPDSEQVSNSLLFLNVFI